MGSLLNFYLRFFFNRKTDDTPSDNENHLIRHLDCFSIYVINVGKLQMTLLLSICVEDLNSALLRDLWNVAITILPSIEDKLFQNTINKNL